VRIVAFVPAHYPERFDWLAEAVVSAQSADRVLIVSTYERPRRAERWRKVDWVFDPDLQSTGSKYREAVRLTGPGDVIAILDDDDAWLPRKAAVLREEYRGPVSYFAHAAAVVRGCVPTGFLGPENANATMTAVRWELLTSAAVKPFFDRLEWACDPFLRYAALAARAPVRTSGAVLAHVRYHSANSSHAPSGYASFAEWQRRTAERYLAGWRLIEEMTRTVGDRPAEIQQKIDEFERLASAGGVRRRISYALSQS
jgi:hypothetical protein